MSEANGAPPFGLYERALAGRYLRAKRAHGGVALISIISFVGIMLAVAALIITMSIMNGFRETLLSRILGVNGHVYIDTQGRSPDERERMLAILKGMPQVKHIAPIVEGQVLAVANGQATGAFVRGIPKKDLESLDIVAKNLVAGDLKYFYVDEDGLADVVLGYRLANRLGLEPGDALSLLSPQGAMTPFGMAPRKKSYGVGALFNVGMSEYDSAFIYMPLDEAQLFFSRGDSVDRLELRIADPDQSAALMKELREKLGPDIFISDWKYQNDSLVNALVVERNVMRMILMAIVTLATLNIITGLVMLVKNKSRDVAILRTMGATQASIMRVFLMAGGAVGLLGTAAGVIGGVLFCLNIGAIQGFVEWVFHTRVFDPSVYSLSRIPAVIEWPEIAFVATFALIITGIAAFLPAWWASRFDPVESLRYE